MHHKIPCVIIPCLPAILVAMMAELTADASGLKKSGR